MTTLAALVVRLIVVAFVFRDQTDPADNHANFGWEMGWVARSIFQGKGFSSPYFPETGPTALVPPIIPYLVAGIFHLFGLYTAKAAFAILSINSVLSALTCIPIYFSARYALGERVARAAMVGWAIYPYSIYFSAARVWDYALTGLLFAICFYCAQRLHNQDKLLTWLGFGALYGFTMLANPSVLPLFAVFMLLAIYRRTRSERPWMLQSGLAVLGLLVMASPWTIRTYRAMHVVVPVRDNFWMECWAGNNGDTFESNATWAHPASNPVEMDRFIKQGEIAYLANQQKMAKDFIQHHPGFFVGLSLHRALSFWSGYWSFAPAYLKQEPLQNADIFFCTSTTILMLIGIVSFWRRNRYDALPYLILIGLFPLTYYVTHASPDYRQPIEPEIVTLAATGVLALKRGSKEAVPDEEEEAKRLDVSIPA